MSPEEKITEALHVSIYVERHKRTARRLLMYCALAAKAHKRYLFWNGRLMRYDIAYRRVETWTITTSKTKTANKAASAWAAWQRLTEIYMRLIKEIN